VKDTLKLSHLKLGSGYKADATRIQRGPKSAFALSDAIIQFEIARILVSPRLVRASYFVMIRKFDLSALYLTRSWLGSMLPPPAQTR